MIRTSRAAALVTAALLGLAGCGASSGDLEDTDTVSAPMDSDEPGEEPTVIEGDSLSSLLTAANTEDFLIEYRINGDEPTLWFVQVNSAADGPVSISIVLDPSGTYNFTAALSGDDLLENPVTELQGAAEYTPGLMATPGPDGVTYTWMNGPSSWTIGADRQDRVIYYQLESPEGTFEMDLLYGSDINQKVPQTFIDGVLDGLEATDQQFVFGVTGSDFQGWQFYDF